MTAPAAVSAAAYAAAISAAPGVAETPRDLVGQHGKARLYRFRPLAPRAVRVPVLIAYGLIGRWTMLDLEPDRSLVRNLLGLGVDLYVAEWYAAGGTPSRADRYDTLDDLVCGGLDRCVEAVAGLAGTGQVSLLGVCQGGTLAACYAALEPRRVHALVLAVTPIDFHADAGVGTEAGTEARAEQRGVAPAGVLGGLANAWARSLRPADIDALIDAHGNLPGSLLGGAFDLLTPVRTLLRTSVDPLEAAGDPERLSTWLRMEQWIADRPDHPGEAARQWLKWFYLENRLARNRLRLDGRRVELRRIGMPVLNAYAVDDHIVPPATSRALHGLVATEAYRELALPGGHIGAFVGARSQPLLAPAIAAFLREHDKPA